MEHISNEEKARHLCCSGCNNYVCYTNKKQCPTLKDLLRMAQWKDEQNTEFLVRIKNAFEGMEQMCDKLTSGNVAHQRPHLKGYAQGWVEIIEEYLKRGENESK